MAKRQIAKGEADSLLRTEEQKKRKQQEIDSQRSKRVPTKEMSLADGLPSIANVVVKAAK
jgi:hypothetical protein